MVGTYLRLKGSADIVKDLAREVSENGGMTIYIDRTLLAHPLASFVDLQLQMDIEKWSLDAPKRPYPNLLVRSQKTGLRISFHVFPITYLIRCKSGSAGSMSARMKSSRP